MLTSDDFIMANNPIIQQQHKQEKIDNPMLSLTYGTTAVVTTDGCCENKIIVSIIVV